MKLYWLVGCLLVIASDNYGQSRRPINGLSLNKISYESSYLRADHGMSTRGIQSDPQTYALYSSPWLTFWPGTSGNATHTYWLGSTTTQSFNKGKFGTIYYYDMMGNMQYARTFIDIAGKNKRGLKLLLPTLNQRMFMQR